MIWIKTVCFARGIALAALLTVSATAQETGILYFTAGDSVSGRLTIIGKTDKSPSFRMNDSMTYPSDKVMAYEMDGKYFGRALKKGLSSRYAYLERKEKGRVDIFYDWNTSWSHDHHLGTSMAWTHYSPSYYAKGREDLQRINAGNLKKSLADHEPSMKALCQRDALRWVGAAFVVTGLGIIASAFQGVDKNHPPNKERLIVGGLVANIAWIPGFMMGAKIDEAITLYNNP